MSNAHRTIRPAKAGQLIMACIGVPVMLLSGGGGAFLALGGDLASAAYAIPLFVLGSWCVLEISTVRLHLSEDRVWLTRWWHTRWSIARDRAELRPARVGDIAVLPGLHVIDRTTGQKVGEIISGQFRTADISELAAALANGGERSRV
jgi:hypothetical protein